MNNPTTSPSHRRIRSFVFRKGRITQGQQGALARLWEQYGIESDHAPNFSRQAPVVLEIGFGDGKSLLETACRQPDSNFLGIEVYPPGIGSLLLKLEYLKLENVKIYRNDAVDILNRCIPAHYLSRINLYFPDPWPKRKHYKRRLVDPVFSSLIAQKLESGGFFHAATDWQEYANQIAAVFSQQIEFENVSKNLEFKNFILERPKTKFEHRGLRAGYQVSDLIFQRI